MQFRDDLHFVTNDDLQIVAESSVTIRDVAVTQGARATFDWMSDCLSNTLFVDGPIEVQVSDPKKAFGELYRAHFGYPPGLWQ